MRRVLRGPSVSSQKSESLPFAEVTRPPSRWAAHQITAYILIPGHVAHGLNLHLHRDVSL